MSPFLKELNPFKVRIHIKFIKSFQATWTFYDFSAANVSAEDDFGAWYFGGDTLGWQEINNEKFFCQNNKPLNTIPPL